MAGAGRGADLGAHVPMANRFSICSFQPAPPNSSRTREAVSKTCWCELVAKMCLRVSGTLICLVCASGKKSPPFLQKPVLQVTVRKKLLKHVLVLSNGFILGFLYCFPFSQNRLLQGKTVV